MANVRISNFPVPFALPVASVINGTETLPFDQTVGGVVTTVSGLFSRLLGPIALNYATGGVTMTPTGDDGLTINGASGFECLTLNPTGVTSPVQGILINNDGVHNVEMAISTTTAGDAYYRAVNLGVGGVNWSWGNQRSTGNFVVSPSVGLGSAVMQITNDGATTSLIGSAAAAQTRIALGAPANKPAYAQLGVGGAVNLYYGVNGAANDLLTGTAAGDAIINSRTSGRTLWFATNNIARSFIDVNGILYNASPIPTAVNATATLTIAQLLTLIITSTTALAVTATLPTGTLTDAGIVGGIAPVNASFDWSVINTGALAFTLAAGTGHTIVGATVVAAATSALFRTIKTATNTFVTYRLAV